MGMLRWLSSFGFYSRDQQPCFLTETKKRICMKIEFNSRRINLRSNMAAVTSSEITIAHALRTKAQVRAEKRISALLK